MRQRLNPKFQEKICKLLDAGKFESVTESFSPAIQWVVKELDRRGLPFKVLSLGAGVKKVMLGKVQNIEAEHQALERIRTAIAKHLENAQDPAACLQEIAGILVGSNRSRKRAAFAKIKPGLTCCEQTLLEMNKVIESCGTTVCAGGSCTDGELVKCKHCQMSLVHVCDEAEGCYWRSQK